VSCDSGTCNATCNSGYHNCGGTGAVNCIAVGVHSCSSVCADCTAGAAPSNSTATTCFPPIPALHIYDSYCGCTCNSGYWPEGQTSCSGLSCSSQSFTTTY
jgi:hypothetical protein